MCRVGKELRAVDSGALTDRVPAADSRRRGASPLSPALLTACQPDGSFSSSSLSPDSRSSWGWAGERESRGHCRFRCDFQAGAGRRAWGWVPTVPPGPCGHWRPGPGARACVWLRSVWAFSVPVPLQAEPGSGQSAPGSCFRLSGPTRAVAVGAVFLNGDCGFRDGWARGVSLWFRSLASSFSRCLWCRMSPHPTDVDTQALVSHPQSHVHGVGGESHASPTVGL